MEENKFWLAVWRIVGIVVSVLILVVGGCTVDQNNKIVKMVKSGQDPIKASCAINGASSSSMAVICGSVASK